MRWKRFKSVTATLFVAGIVSVASVNAGQVEAWNGQTGLRDSFNVLFNGGIYTNNRWVEAYHCPGNAGFYNWGNPWQYVRQATAEELKNLPNPESCELVENQEGTADRNPVIDMPGNVDQVEHVDDLGFSDDFGFTDPEIQQGLADIFKENDFDLGMYWEIYDVYMESNIIQVKGLKAPVAVSVYGSHGTLGLWEDSKEADDTGEYRINYGPWTKSSGTVKNGDWVQVRHKPSVDDRSSFTSTTLVIGNKKGEFRTDGNREYADQRMTDVEPITIAEKFGSPGKWVESEPFQLEGDFPQEIPFAHVSMVSSKGEYRTLIRDGEKFIVHSKWTSKKAQDIISRLYIQLRVKAPLNSGESVTAKIKCSDEVGSFTVTADSQ